MEMTWRQIPRNWLKLAVSWRNLARRSTRWRLSVRFLSPPGMQLSYLTQSTLIEMLSIQNIEAMCACFEMHYLLNGNDNISVFQYNAFLEQHPSDKSFNYIVFRTKSRKEKNKLASRACRLKKKAQHEANKIKLSGLEDEHSKWNLYNNEVVVSNLTFPTSDELMRSLQQMKQIVHAKWTKSNGASAANMTQEELTAEAEKILKKSQSKNFCKPQEDLF